MKRSHAVLIVVSVVLTAGLAGLQIWLHEQQLALQRTQAELRQAQMQARTLAPPGQPAIPPPIVYQPPIVMPLFPMFWPFLMAPLLLVAAAQQQRLQKLLHEEEEDKTPYTEEELMQDWEFKIIRSPRGLFEHPKFLEHILQEEARAGWQLVEKFDGTRVRLKRLVAEQSPASDLPQGYDPYRTAVGPRFHLQLLLSQPLCILCVVLVATFILLQIFDAIPTQTFLILLALAVAGSILSGIWAYRETAKYKKSAYLS